MVSTGVIHKTFNCAKTDNQNYHVHIKCPGSNFEVIADIAEDFATAVGSEWEALLPNSVGDIPAVGGLLHGIGKTVLGTSALLQYFSQQVWVNSSPIEIPISLSFKADKDSFEEVVAPCRALEALVMPNMVGGILYSPGPSVGGVIGGALSVDLIVGRQLHLTDVIVVNASTTTSSRLDSRGLPTSARCDLTIRSNRTLSRDEWLEATIGNAL